MRPHLAVCDTHANLLGELLAVERWAPTLAAREELSDSIGANEGCSIHGSTTLVFAPLCPVPDGNTTQAKFVINPLLQELTTIRHEF
jgi:hypothetical protein